MAPFSHPNFFQQHILKYSFIFFILPFWAFSLYFFSLSYHLRKHDRKKIFPHLNSHFTPIFPTKPATKTHSPFPTKILSFLSPYKNPFNFLHQGSDSTHISIFNPPIRSSEPHFEQFRPLGSRISPASFA